MSSSYKLKANDLNQDFIDAIKKLYGTKKITVTVKDDDEIWNDFSANQLSKAYGSDEPDYNLSMVNEPNPNFKK